MEILIAAGFAVITAIIVLLTGKRPPVKPPTNEYEPKPDTGAPEPKPGENYPLPDQPEPDLPPLPDINPPDPEPLPPSEPQVPAPEPEPQPEPTPEPQPEPPAPPKPLVYSAAQQDEFFKAIGLPYGTAAKRKESTGKFQFGCTWTNLVVDNSFGQLTTAAAETCKANNYRVSRYFHLYEFRCKGQDPAQGSGSRCKNCKIIYMHRDVIRALDREREEIYRGPLNITNGYRCDGYNAYVGGVANSAHKLGLAADIPRKFSWRRFVGRGWHGIGKSRVDRESVVHVDRDTRLRADYVFQE